MEGAPRIYLPLVPTLTRLSPVDGVPVLLLLNVQEGTKGTLWLLHRQLVVSPLI